MAGIGAAANVYLYMPLIMNEKITPELFDSVLNFLIDHVPFGGFVHFDSVNNPIPFPNDLSYAALGQLLREMKADGLISLYYDGSNSDSYQFDVGINRLAVTLQKRGGYVGQEVLLRQNIEKLLFEIEHLRPSNPKQVETLSTIAANITTALGFIVGSFMK